MARYLPYFFIGLSVLFMVLALRGWRPGESLFSPQRRTWLIISAIFLIVGTLLLRVVPG